jgi:uncharacterized protein DUF4403
LLEVSLPLRADGGILDFDRIVLAGLVDRLPPGCDSYDIDWHSTAQHISPTCVARKRINHCCNGIKRLENAVGYPVAQCRQSFSLIVEHFIQRLDKNPAAQMSLDQGPIYPEIFTLVLKPFANDAKAKIAAALTEFQQVGDGVMVEATVKDLRLTGIEFDAHTLRVIAEASGGVGVSVTQLPQM